MIRGRAQHQRGGGRWASPSLRVSRNPSHHARLRDGVSRLHRTWVRYARVTPHQRCRTAQMQDVRDGRKRSDAVALGAWGVEWHDRRTFGSTFEFPPNGAAYPIPLGCLRSRDYREPVRRRPHCRWRSRERRQSARHGNILRNGTSSRGRGRLLGQRRHRPKSRRCNPRCAIRAPFSIRATCASGVVERVDSNHRNGAPTTLLWKEVEIASSGLPSRRRLHSRAFRRIHSPVGIPNSPRFAAIQGCQDARRKSIAALATRAATRPKVKPSCSCGLPSRVLPVVCVLQLERQKAAANARKHGVTFAEAETVFDDPFAGITEDTERRTTDLLGNRIAAACCSWSTWRSTRTRSGSISARRATKTRKETL